jgi:hypothetical protein
VWTRGGHTLLDFSLSAEDGGEWHFEASFELASLAGLRAELAAGDLRPLQLGWPTATAPCAHSASAPHAGWRSKPGYGQLPRPATRVWTT